MKPSACIEMLFKPEETQVEKRIELAAAAGFEWVEFWQWTNKDIGAIKAACSRTGVRLSGFVAEPMISLNDPANHASFIEGLKRSVDVAKELSTPILIAQAGYELPDQARAVQRNALADCLSQSADILKGSGTRLALEPLNSLIDHPGYFLTDTGEALDIIDDVDREEIGLLYDIYHSMVMGEDPAHVLAGRMARVYHVHVADHPGRNQPGSGRLPLADTLSWLKANGYDGNIGLEFRPTGDTASALKQMEMFLPFP